MQVHTCIHQLLHVNITRSHCTVSASLKNLLLKQDLVTYPVEHDAEWPIQASREALRAKFGFSTSPSPSLTPLFPPQLHQSCWCKHVADDPQQSPSVNWTSTNEQREPCVAGNLCNLHLLKWQSKCSENGPSQLSTALSSETHSSGWPS